MAAKDENRCWPGYEPVKGKDPHSEGSCRPKVESKLAPSEKEFRAKRKRQLDKWQEEHPKTRRQASQHLSEPGSAKKKKPAAKKRAGATAKRTGAKRKTSARKGA